MMYGPKSQAAPRQVVTPRWVPAAVKCMAEVMPIGKPIAHRLLTDERMEKVWPVLRRSPVLTEEIPCALSGPAFHPYQLQLANLNSHERLKHWGVPDRSVDFRDEACAALFAFAVIEFSQSRPTGTRSDAEALAAPIFSAAETCRWIAIQAPSPSPEEKNALEVAAAYIESWAGWQYEHLLGSSYTVGENSSGDNIIRARTRALAAATHRIFGSFLYNTVATTATVALQIEPDISGRNVRNWCADLNH